MAELKTRIQLKYDSYERWLAHKDLIPLKGEVCVVNPSTGSDYNYDTTTACLMKVGDGTTSFEKLPWLSALAADVHAWAKKDETEFVTWATETGVTIDGVNVKFATKAEINALDNRIDNLETKVGTAAEGETAASGLFADIARIEADIDTLEELVGLGNTGEGQSITDRVIALETSQGEQNETLEELAGSLTTLNGTVASHETTLALLTNTAETEGSIKYQIAAEAKRATEAEEALQGKLDVLAPKPEDANKSIRDIAADEINTLIGGANNEDTIHNINTLIEYVNTNGASTTQLLTDVDKAKADIASLSERVAENTTNIGNNTTAINTINTKIGTVAEGSTLVGMLEALTETVNTNTENINKEKERAEEAEEALQNSIDTLSNKALSFKHTEGSEVVQFVEGETVVETLVFNCGDSDLTA